MAQDTPMPEDRQVQMDALRAALIAGEESGKPAAFDFDAFIGTKGGSAAPQA